MIGIKFPSPINGVSFKPTNTTTIIKNGIELKFPSPINGVSFKLVYR